MTETSHLKDKACGKMRRKKVQKWGESKWKNQTKQVDQHQPKDTRRRRPPKSRDEGCRETCQWTKISKSLPKSTEPRRQSTTDLSLSRRRSNELRKGGWLCQKMRPTDKPKAHWEAVNRDTLRSRPRSLLGSRPVKSYWEAESPPGCSLPRHAPRCWPRSLPRSRPRFYWSRLLRTIMKSTGWSPKQTSKNYWNILNLQVNAEYRWLPVARYILQSMRKHCR